MSLQFWAEIVTFTFFVESFLVSVSPLFLYLPLLSLSPPFSQLSLSFFFSLLLPFHLPLLPFRLLLPPFHLPFLRLPDSEWDSKGTTTRWDRHQLPYQPCHGGHLHQPELLPADASGEPVCLSVCLSSISLSGVCLTVCLSTYLSSGYKIVWLLVSLLVFFMFRRESLILWENQTHLLEKRQDKWPLWLTGK